MDPPAVHILWDNLTDLLCDLFGVERANLFLVIPEKQQLRTRAASQFEWDVVLAWEDGVAGHVYQNGAVSLINDIPNSEYSHHFNRDPEGYATRSMVTVPVFRDGDENQSIVALIQLVNKIGSPFDESDLEALRYWARQIGISLERSHGTEIWRHPESEPPFLNDPEFNLILPQLSAKEIMHNLASCVAKAVCEWRSYHLQSQNMTRSQSPWENHELMKMVRDECRHSHVVEQLAEEAPEEGEGLSGRYKFLLKLFRLMSLMTRSHCLSYLLGAYREWFSFFSSAFLYRLYEGMPRERNLLHAIVENERSHGTFFESRLLDHMIQYPQLRYKMYLFQRLARFFYGRLTRRLIEPFLPVVRRRELPGQFAELFLRFTDHRLDSLQQRAELRAPLATGWWSWLTTHWVGWFYVMAYAAVALFLAPLALLWPIHAVTKEEEDERQTAYATP